MTYEYECPMCYEIVTLHRAVDDRDDEVLCTCGDKMHRLVSFPAVIGTRDGFGIGNAFKDEKTGKEITTWKEWEKAGYRSIEDGKLPRNLKAQIKEKKEKIKTKDGKKITVGGK